MTSSECERQPKRRPAGGSLRAAVARTLRTRTLTAPVLLAGAALMGAPAVSAADSARIEVSDGDTVSGLFRKANVPLGQLMTLLHSSDTAERTLDRVRPGAVVSITKGGDGKLQRVQIVSKTGKQSTFARAVDPQTGSQKWQVLELHGEQLSAAAATTPADQAQTNTNKANAEAAVARSEGNRTIPKVLPSQPVNRDVEFDVIAKAEKRAFAWRRTTVRRSAGESVAQAAKAGAERPASASKADDKVARLAKSVRQAELLVASARMLALSTAPRRTPAGLSGMSAKIFDAEQRAERVRARRWLVEFGQRNPSAVMRVASNQINLGKHGGRRANKLLSSAKRYLGTPYLWGGTTPEGFDCSGFVVYNLNRIGVQVPRTAHQQFNHTKTRPVSRENLMPGDLVFFHDRHNRRRIGHVGIYIGNDKFIHAVARNIPVKITSLKKAYYARRFVRGGRVIS
ncbi:MAG: NlpC/P60 family protein [Pseudomonadota bacterium]